MRIQHLVSSIDRTAAGVFAVLRDLMITINQLPDTEVRVVSLKYKYTYEDISEWLPIRPSIVPIKYSDKLGYAPDLLKVLSEWKADIGHSHGLWMYLSIAHKKWANSTNKPYIISVHGMLDPWALQNSSLKKWIAARLFERNHLSGASCIHATTKFEAKAIRDYGLSNPICVIPNGVNLPGEKSPALPTWLSEIKKNAKVLLYLGRLHPKKGLENLLHALKAAHKYKKANEDDWRLIIAGWHQGNYDKKLKGLVRDLGLAGKVFIVGPQYGDSKQALYHNADAFILPSFSEGLPTVILEAWSYRLPVLMTPQCNLPEGFEAKAAIEILPTVDGIATGLEQLFAMPESELHSMGEGGRKLVHDRFDWARIGRDMRSIYEWIVSGGKPPKDVVTYSAGQDVAL
jgi:poly(glycerol-phosphate) alpha-glucosyltransferase